MQTPSSLSSHHLHYLAQKIGTHQSINRQDRQFLRKRLLNVFLEDSERELLEEIYEKLHKGLIDVLD